MWWNNSNEGNKRDNTGTSNKYKTQNNTLGNKLHNNMPNISVLK